MRSRMSPCLFLVAAAVLLTIPALGQELPGIRPDGATLRDALAQIQLAYVQVRAAVEGHTPPEADEQ